ncbi:DDE-type integrase/transposase/recombinase [Pseudoxanthomonas sp. PXM02]|uniref:integrase catalytic domain-containing protein n=1 Tax=Pseudoxanthomonas sp. PXM02 TaxID=2769294 RepID=UPI001782478E|nr:DDE-type integrase/transposase/recombinase [Pseudoxanthomonas sp. PXM02]MBD9480344.1 DDE-type integrase/transposase/recombinase [Pseudoxanthomonas sp. PXM02]
MDKMEIGGPDEQTRRGIYAAAGLSHENVRRVEEAINGSCQKRVGAGALTNVVTRFDSVKNRRHRTVESHTCELIHAYELEQDPDVLGYYTQVPCVGITRVRPNGRTHVSSAHIDFLVIRKCAIELVECKQEEWLHKAIGEDHPDWSQVQGGWTCRPYEEWAKARGIQFKVWVGPRHPAIYLQNLTAIYDAKRLEPTDYEVRACETASRLIEKRPQSIAELQNKSAGFTSRVALLMLAQAYAFGPCKSVSISQQSKFYLFPTLTQAEVYANAVAAEVSDRLRSLEELGDETLTATGTDLEKARLRLERVDRYLGGLDLAPTKSVKRLAKIVQQARSEGKSALAACLTRYHASGNKIPRLSDQYVALRRRVVDEYWNRGRVSCQRDACHIYSSECERLGIPVAGLTALMKAIREQNPDRHALASGGMRSFQRVRRNADPRYTSAAPLGYGEIAHIDSTPIDMRMVDGSTGEILHLSATFYIAIDGSSGYPLAFVLIFGPSRTEGLAILMRQIVRRHGFLPRTIHVDRGPENTSKWMEKFCEGTISVRYSPTAGSAWNQLAESANKYANTQVSHRLFGSTLPDSKGRSVDGKYKSLKTARMSFLEVNELIEKYVYGDMPHSPGGDNLSPIERRQASLDQFGCMGAKREINDAFLLSTAIPLGGAIKLTARGSIRIEEGVYTSMELQAEIKGRRKVEEARIDCEDPAILYTRIGGRWLKAFHRRVQSVASEDRLERIFDMCYAPTARKLSREVKRLLRKQLHDRIEQARTNSLAKVDDAICSKNTPGKGKEKTRKPDLDGPLFDSEG